MSAPYYIWSAANSATAQAMLDAINGHEKLPLVGVCNGKPAPDKQLTTMWAEELTEFVDGRFGFPKIPDGVLDSLGISGAERDGILAAFAPEVIDKADLPLTVAEQYAIDNPDII